MKSEQISTKERLLYAAIKVFAQYGYKEATVREICQVAQSANINSVSYYYGNKEKLYDAVLDFMFAAQQSRLEQYAPPKNPAEFLKNYISSYCEMLYGGGEIARDLIKIFVAEMARPSAALDAIVEQHTRPEVAAVMANVSKLLGESAAEDTVRDTCISIGSQILYYSYAWPVFSRVFPRHPGMQAYHETLSEHIFCFSLGGIEAIKKSMEGCREE